MGGSKNEKRSKLFMWVPVAVVAQALLLVGLIAIWENPHIWINGADDFKKKVCPESKESFETAVAHFLKKARLVADKTKNEYHYRKQKMELEAIVERCQNWRDQFDQEFKEKCKPTSYGDYGMPIIVGFNFVVSSGYFLFTQWKLMNTRTLMKPKIIILFVLEAGFQNEVLRFMTALLRMQSTLK